ncbi:MAG: glucosaminidase domain-containing protein [Gemmatimonadota bacterium]
MTALVSVSAGGAITGFSFVPHAAADIKAPGQVPIHLLALDQEAHRPAASDSMLRSAIVNVSRYYLRMAGTRTPAEMEAIIWQRDSIDGVDHGASCAAFASLTLELAAQVVGQHSWVTGGTSYPWPLHKWADVRVDPNPDSPGITSIVQDAIAHHRWHPLDSGYRPLPGDWVMFDGHVEVITSYRHGVLNTVGGDSLPDFSVNAHEYRDPLAAQGVAGFVNNGAIDGVPGADGHTSPPASRDHHRPPSPQPTTPASPTPAASSPAPANPAPTSPTPTSPVPASPPASPAGSASAAPAPDGSTAAIPGIVTPGPPQSTQAAPEAAAGRTGSSPAQSKPPNTSAHSPHLTSPPAPAPAPPASTPATSRPDPPAPSASPSPPGRAVAGAATQGPVSTGAQTPGTGASTAGRVPPAAEPAIPGLPASPAGGGAPAGSAPGAGHAHHPADSAALTGSPAPAAGPVSADVPGAGFTGTGDAPGTAVGGTAIPGLVTAVLSAGAGSAPAQPSGHGTAGHGDGRSAAASAGQYGRHEPSLPASPVHDTAAQEAFIRSVAPGAVAAQRRYGVPASVTIAQAIDESGWGLSSLATRDHNLFGIKGTGPAGSDPLPTQEYVNGRWVTVVSPFRAYRDAAQSIEDHGQLLATSGYYQRAMAVRQDPDAFATALTGVYATDPGYGAKIIAIMKRYDLYRYDATTRVPAGTASSGAASSGAAPSSAASSGAASSGAAPSGAASPGAGPTSPAPSPAPSLTMPSPAPSGAPSPTPDGPAASPAQSGASPSPTPPIVPLSPAASGVSPFPPPSTPPAPGAAPANAAPANAAPANAAPLQSPRSRGAASAASPPLAQRPPGSAPDIPGVYAPGDSRAAAAVQPSATPRGGAHASAAHAAPRQRRHPAAQSPRMAANFPRSSQPPTAGGRTGSTAASQPRIPGTPVAPATGTTAATGPRPARAANGPAARAPSRTAGDAAPEVQTAAAIQMTAPASRPASPPAGRRAPSRPARGRAVRYKTPLPPSVRTAFTAMARVPLLRQEPLYREVASLTGVRWELLAACDWMQCEARPRHSPVRGEKLGTRNPDGTIYWTKGEALGQCAADLVNLPRAVYGIDVASGRDLSVDELAQVFAAFRWGGLLKAHHTSAMEFPYSVAGLTAQRLKMRWPNIDDPNAPDKPGTRFRMPFGAVPVALCLKYPATV